MLAVSTRTKRSSTQRRHRCSSSADAPSPPLLPPRPANLFRGRHGRPAGGVLTRHVPSPWLPSTEA
jgi:hypothetical protein